MVVSPNDRRLYVTDYAKPNIYVIDIDPSSSDFHTLLTTIQVSSPLPQCQTGGTAGLRGIDISGDGTRLFVAAPQTTSFRQECQEPEEGHVHVIDAIINQQIDTIQADLEPFGVTAVRDRVAITNRYADGEGFAVIRPATSALMPPPIIESASFSVVSDLVATAFGQPIQMSPFNRSQGTLQSVRITVSGTTFVSGFLPEFTVDGQPAPYNYQLEINHEFSGTNGQFFDFPSPAKIHLVGVASGHGESLIQPQQFFTYEYTFDDASDLLGFAQANVTNGLYLPPPHIFGNRQAFVETDPPGTNFLTLTQSATVVSPVGLIPATVQTVGSIQFHYTYETHVSTWQVDPLTLDLWSPHDRFDVNNAQAIAILPANTVSAAHPEYAFVTGYNRYLEGIQSHDPNLNPEKPVGGNIGIIRNPLGDPNDINVDRRPKLVAGTGQFGFSFPDNLVLSADGKFLYAAFTGMNSVLVYDTASLVNEVEMNLGNTVIVNPVTGEERPVHELRPVDGLEVRQVELPLVSGQFTTVNVGQIVTGDVPQNDVDPLTMFFLLSDRGVWVKTYGPNSDPNSDPAPQPIDTFLIQANAPFEWYRDSNQAGPFDPHQDIGFITLEPVLPQAGERVNLFWANGPAPRIIRAGQHPQGIDIQHTPISADPTLSVNLPSFVTEGDPVMVVGTIDRNRLAGDLTALIQWGDGQNDTLIVPAGQSSFSLSHTYVDDDPTGTRHDEYVVDVRVGPYHTQRSLIVANDGPVLSLEPPALEHRNSQDFVTLVGSFEDAGIKDTHTVRVDWGDQTQPTQLDLPVGERIFSLEHKYQNIPSSPIHVYVEDDDRGVASEATFLPAISSQEVVRMSTQVHELIGTACRTGGVLNFTLYGPGIVSFLIDGQVATSAIVDGVAIPVFDNVFMPAGKYAISLFEVDQLRDTGNYNYTLVANIDGDLVSDGGIILHEISGSSNLPIGHTIVKGVDIWDGHVAHSTQDVSVKGRGLSLNFTRTYGSAGKSSGGPLGAGWNHSYNVSLVSDQCGGLTVIGGEGTGNRFLRSTEHPARQGTKEESLGLGPVAKFYDPQIGYHSTLVQTNPTTYDFYTKAHVRYHFELAPSPGPTQLYKLMFIEEPNGNRIELYYDNNDSRFSSLPSELQEFIDEDASTLDVVKDSSDRALLLDYEYIFGEQRIASLSGFDLHSQDNDLLGLNIEYRYDEGTSPIEEGNLTSVIRHGSNPGLNDTRTEAYQYTAGIAADGHNLRFYTDPNGNTTEYRYYNSGPVLPLPNLNNAFWVQPYEFVKEIIEPAPGINADPNQANPVPDHEAPVTVFTYFDPNLNSRQVSDPRPGVLPTIYTMNNYGATIKVEEPLGSNPSAKVTLTEWCTDAPHPSCVNENGDPRIDALIVARTDAEGQRTEYQYDSLGNVVKETVIFSTDKRPVMDDGHAVTQIETTYTYDPIFSRITSRTDPEGNTTVYCLDSEFPNSAAGQHQILCPATSQLNTGNVLSVTDAERNETTYVYALPNATSPNHGPGDLLLVTDPRGVETNFEEYDDFGNPIQLRQETHGGKSILTEQQFDVRSRLERKTDTFGHHVEYTYDLLDRRISETKYDDVLSTTAPGMPWAENSSWVFKPNGELLRMTDGLGQVTSYEYDNLNRSISVIEQGIKQADGTFVDLITKSHFDEVGNVVTDVDRRGVARKHTFDELNRLVQTQIVEGPDANDVGFDVSPSNRQVIAQYEYDLVNNKTAETDLHRNETRYLYDGLYRVVEIGLPFDHNFLDVPFGNLPGNNAAIRKEYDLVGNVKSETDANGNETTYDYDSIYRLLNKIDADNNAIDYEYDRSNNIVRETHTSTGQTTYEVFYDNGNKIEDGLNRPQSKTEIVYLGDPTSLTPIEYVTAFEYDDDENLTTAINPRGTVPNPEVSGRSVQQRDGLDRLVLTIVDEGAGGLNLTTEQRYDGNGNLILIIDPKPAPIANTGPTSSTSHFEDFDVKYEYDGLNRQICAGYIDTPSDQLVNRVTGQCGGEGQGVGVVEKFRYDGNDNLVQHVDKRGFTFLSSYDNLNRKLSDSVIETATNNSRELTLMEYQYDDPANSNGQYDVTEIDANGNITQKTYDALGRVTIINDPDPVGTVRFEYDGVNKRTETDKKDYFTEYSYDAINRLVDVSEYELEGGPLHTTLSTVYDDEHQRVTNVDRRGIETIQQNDSRGRLIQLSRSHPSLSQLYSVDTVVLEEYEYDGNNNKTLFRDARAIASGNTQGNRISYTYDGADRMTSMTEGFGSPVAATTTYTYDNVNNLLTVKDGRSHGVTNSNDCPHGNNFDFCYTYDARYRKVSETNGEE